jgi:hypothetical protein
LLLRIYQPMESGLVGHSISFSIPSRAHIPICSPHAATAKEIHPTVEAAKGEQGRAIETTPACHGIPVTLHACRAASQDGDRRTSQGKHPNCQPRRRARLAWWRSTVVASLRISSAAGPTSKVHFITFICMLYCICFSPRQNRATAMM